MTENEKNILNLNSDTKNNPKIITKPISLNEIQSTSGKTPKIKKRVKYLGIKRKLHLQKKKTLKISRKKLKISGKVSYSIYTKQKIKNIYNNNDKFCIICLENISFEEKHFLHCGHCFHCQCINKWLENDNDKCPICKQNIECNKHFNEDDEISEIDISNDDNVVTNRINNFSLNPFEGFNFLYYYYLVILLYFLIKGFLFRRLY